MPSVIHPADVGPESGHWSHATLSPIPPGVMLVSIAGQTATDSSGGIVGGDDFDTQFRVVYDNLWAVLRAADGTPSDVQSFTTYLTRVGDLERFRELREWEHERVYPGGDYPPNTLLVVTALAHPDLLLEIQALALIPPKSDAGAV